MADRYAGDRYSAPFYGYWNTAMHFTTFIINAITFAKIKSSLDQRHELERALVKTREQLRQVANGTNFYPRCHGPDVPEPLRAKSAEFLAPMPSEALSVASSEDRGERGPSDNTSFPGRGDVSAVVAP